MLRPRRGTPPPPPAGSSASSASSFRSMPFGPFSIAISGFVVSGSSSGGSSSVQSASVLPESRCASSRSSCSASFFRLRVARLRLLRDALEPLLDVVAVGDEQLELQRLEIVVRDARPREAVEHDEQRVDLAQVAEQRRAGAAHLDDANRRGRDLARIDDVGELLQPRIRDRRHPHLAARARTGERLEQHRLAGARQARRSRSRAPSSRLARSASAATRARGAATT